MSHALVICDNCVKCPGRELKGLEHQYVAKEVGWGNPFEEEFRHPSRLQFLPKTG